jgi:ParB family chromosome partitioning protein
LALKLQSINAEAKAAGSLQDLPLSLLRPDPNQPRKKFTQIDSLAKSIAENGIIQPIIVTSKAQEGVYTIIAGERRYQAAIRAKLASIPCIIRDENDANIMILQLLENDQREDVSPLEESDALQKLVGDLSVSKAQIGKELGRDSAWVSIRLGLQQASDDIKKLIKDGFVEDVRTLHELRMFERETPDKAKQLIDQIRKNQVSGSYRQVIAGLRQPKKQEKIISRGGKKPQKIRKIEQENGLLYLHVTGSKRPLSFEITPQVLVQFMAEMTYED